MSRDAADIEPKFVPLDALMPRDNSGGEGFSPHSGEFGEGGRVTGPKSYLGVGGKSK